MIDETKKQLEKNSTKGKAEAVASVIQYQQRKDVKSISITGAEDLAEVSRDEFNHVTIEMKRDDTKENRLESTNTDLLEIERQEGTEPTLLHAKHDATKEQKLVADNNLIEITSGTNATNEYTKLLVPHDENKIDEINIKENSKDMLKISEIKDGEHPNIIKQLELELDLPIFWYTWGEFYDYVAIYALGNTLEKYKGHANFLEDDVEGMYNEEKNVTVYIFITNQYDYSYNPYIVLIDSEGIEVYRVIARSANIEQNLKYAPDYIEGNYDEEGLNINDRHNELKDKFESYINNAPDVLLNSLDDDNVSKVDRVIQDTETIQDLYQRNIDLVARVEALENGQ